MEEWGREQIPSVELSSPFTCHFTCYLKLEIFLHYVEGTSVAGIVSHFRSSHKGYSAQHRIRTCSFILDGQPLPENLNLRALTSGCSLFAWGSACVFHEADLCQWYLEAGWKGDLSFQSKWRKRSVRIKKTIGIFTGSRYHPKDC